MACIGKAKQATKMLTSFKDDQIQWILDQHSDVTWNENEKPENSPQLRRWMRLTKQEARKRGLI